MRPGWGLRHPAIAEILRSSRPLAEVTTRWAAGTLPLRIEAYTPLVDLPDELVASVRWLVTVDEGSSSARTQTASGAGAQLPPCETEFVILSESAEDAMRRETMDSAYLVPRQDVATTLQVLAVQPTERPQ